MKRILLLFFLISPAILGACRECQSEELIRVELYFVNQEPGQFTEVFNEYISLPVNDDYVPSFPLTLNSDTTTIYFRRHDGGLDTVSIAYRRDTDFENAYCGFYFDISDPLVLPETSFEDVTAQKLANVLAVYL